MNRHILFILGYLSTLMVGCMDRKSSEQKNKVDDSTLIISNDTGKKDSIIKKVPQCHLAIDDPAHFNPFYNGHLHENFDPNGVDFSEDFYRLRNKYFQSDNTIFESLNDFDFSTLWLRPYGQIGIIGNDYRRIDVRINRVSKSQNNQLSYNVEGVSMVNDNRCDFKGTIDLSNAYLYKKPDIEGVLQGMLYGRYSFHEDTHQKHSGTFKGVVESSFLIENKKVFLDTLSDVADGYNNNNFVGTWMQHGKTSKKKCIWGEYRLPFTFDFDIGDGEMVVNEKYRNNGWN